MTYRLLSYGPSSSPRAGLCVGDRVYDAAGATGVPQWSSVLDALQDWGRAHEAFEAAATALTANPKGQPGEALADVTLHSPVLYPGTIYCAGANYVDHLAEMAKAAGKPPGPSMRELGETPWHFIKASRSCVVGPNAAIKMPDGANQVDWEIELAVVIGKQASKVSAADALNYVAGYMVANDLSARDLSRRSKNPPTSPFYYDWISHKSFDSSCPMGPWMVPASAIPQPGKLGLKLWVGDELMQDSNTSGMVFGIEDQIAALSSRVTLQPGDVVLTGTPAGVGNGRGRFLKPGETVRMWIEGIGEMSHTMV